MASYTKMVTTLHSLIARFSLPLMCRLCRRRDAANTAEAIVIQGAIGAASAAWPMAQISVWALADRGGDLERKLMLVKPCWRWSGAEKLSVSAASRPLFTTTRQFYPLPRASLPQMCTEAFREGRMVQWDSTPFSSSLRPMSPRNWLLFVASRNLLGHDASCGMRSFGAVAKFGLTLRLRLSFFTI